MKSFADFKISENLPLINFAREVLLNQNLNASQKGKD